MTSISDPESDHITSRLQTTNAAPSLYEKNLIHNLIKNIDGDISQLDQVISHLESQLSACRTKRTVHLEQRSVYASLVSSLRELPLEILGRIFVYACTDSESWSSRVHVSHVCQHWRYAALACSELWSTINIWPTQMNDSVKSSIQTWIRRANNRPLTWICHKAFFDEGADCDTFAFILKQMDASQFKELIWSFPGGKVPAAESRLLVALLKPNSVNTLESLTFINSGGFHSTIDNVGDDVELKGRRLDLRTFSRLSKMHISLYYPIESDILNAPWSQLTHLSLGTPRIDPATILTILRQCLNLEVCVLDLHYFHPVLPEGDQQPIYLPKLHKLHLRSATADTFEKIFGPLVTPILRDLIVDAETIFFELSENDAVKHYLATCAPTLRRLWVSGIGHEDIQEFVAPTLERLEELTLVGLEEMDEDAFNALEFSSDIFRNNIGETFDGSADESERRAIPFPHLSVLKIICRVYPHLQNAFMDIVESRWWPDGAGPANVTRLRYASLQQRDEEHRLSVTDRVTSLRKAGMNVNVLTPAEDEFVPKFHG